MAEDWLVDVRKYAANADENVVQAIVRYCGIALQSRDGQLVAMSDKKERETVRENYLKKKLGLTNPDAELDEGVLAIGQRMKEDRTKNRVTVYYLLAEHFGSLNIFGGAAGSAASLGLMGAAGVAGTTGAAAAGSAGSGGSEPQPPPAAATPVEPAPVSVAAPPPPPPPAMVEPAAPLAAAAPMEPAPMPVPEPSPPPAAATPSYAASSYDDDGAAGGGIWGWLKWLLLAAVLLALLFFLLRSCSGQDAAPVVDDSATEAVGGETAEAGADADAAKVEAEPANFEQAATPAPTGSGIVASERDGKPMLKVYFDTAKTNVPADFAKVAAVIKDYSAKNPGAKFAVAGFNDPRGNAASNAKLSKGRADEVSKALAALGVPAGSVEVVASTTDSTSELNEARRVEVTVK